MKRFMNEQTETTNPYNILLLLQAPAQRAARNAELPRSGGTGRRD